MLCCSRAKCNQIIVSQYWFQFLSTAKNSPLASVVHIAIHRQTPMGVKKVVRATCLLAAPISLPRVPDPTAIYRQTFALLVRHSCRSLLRNMRRLPWRAWGSWNAEPKHIVLVCYFVSRVFCPTAGPSRATVSPVASRPHVFCWPSNSLFDRAFDDTAQSSVDAQYVAVRTWRSDDQLIVIESRILRPFSQSAIHWRKRTNLRSNLLGCFFCRLRAFQQRAQKLATQPAQDSWFSSCWLRLPRTISVSVWMSRSLANQRLQIQSFLCGGAFNAAIQIHLVGHNTLASE